MDSASTEVIGEALGLAKWSYYCLVGKIAELLFFLSLNNRLGFGESRLPPSESGLNNPFAQIHKNTQGVGRRVLHSGRCA